MFLIRNITDKLASILMAALGVIGRVFAHSGHHIGAFDFYLNPKGRIVPKLSFEFGATRYEKYNIAPQFRHNFCNRISEWAFHQQHRIMVRWHKTVSERAVIERQRTLEPAIAKWEPPVSISLTTIARSRQRNAAILGRLFEQNPDWQDELAGEVN